MPTSLALTRCIVFPLGVLNLFACAGVAIAQNTTTAPKIGIVYTQPHPVINEIIAGFKAVVLGTYPNTIFIEKHADGRPEQYGTAVLATINANPDIVAPITTPITKLAVEQARGRIPIVFMGVTDPVGAGVARSIDAPQIATGSSDLCPFASLLDVTRTVLPTAKVLGLPYNPTDEPAVFGRSQLLALAPAHGFSVVDRQITSATELSTEIRNLALRTDAIIIAADNLMMENPTAVSEAALEAAKPTFACDSASVKAGAVAGVSVQYRQVGELAGKRAIDVLKGMNAGSLPVAVLNSGGIAVDLKASCLARVKLPQALITDATDVFDKDYKCNPQP
jgi:putative ABC transport system substrate-binding protein